MIITILKLIFLVHATEDCSNTHLVGDWISANDRMTIEDNCHATTDSSQFTIDPSKVERGIIVIENKQCKFFQKAPAFNDLIIDCGDEELQYHRNAGTRYYGGEK